MWRILAGLGLAAVGGAGMVKDEADRYIHEQRLMHHQNNEKLRYHMAKQFDKAPWSRSFLEPAATAHVRYQNEKLRKAEEHPIAAWLDSWFK